MNNVSRWFWYWSWGVHPFPKEFSERLEQHRVLYGNHRIGGTMWPTIAAMHLIGLLAIFSPLAYGGGASPNYSDLYRTCLHDAGNTNALLACLAAEKSKWDIRLVDTYQRLMASRDFSAETKQRLREAQALWKIFREKSCDADGPSTQRMVPALSWLEA